MTDGVQKYSSKSCEVLVEDANGNKQLCFATYNLGTGYSTVSSSGSSAVSSVNTKTGAVVLTGEDIKTSTDSDSETISTDISALKLDVENRCLPVPTSDGTYYIKATKSGSSTTYELATGNFLEVVSTMTPASSNLGKYVLYDGTTNSSYTNGYIYRSTMTDNTPEAVEVSISNATGIGTVTCNAGTFGDMVYDQEGEYEFVYSGYPETIKIEQNSTEKTLTRSRTNDTNGKYGWVDANGNVYLSSSEDMNDDVVFEDVNRTSDFTPMYMSTLTTSTTYGYWQWDLGDDCYENVDLADYGISYNGVAPVNARITITYTPEETIADTYVWTRISLG